jgi:predicted dehydrogenase
MKVAIVGFGNIAIKHKQAIEFCGDSVVASVNRSERGNQLAKDHGITQTYTSVHDLLSNVQPDAILVTVSFEHIFEITKLLIPYKIPLLIEKPAGTSVAELNELISLSSRYGTTVQLAMNRRHYEIVEAAIEDMGGLDYLMAVDIEWSETPIKLLTQKGYTKEQVAKIIYGNSIHGIDMACFFGGVMEDIYVQTKKIGEDFRWYMQFAGKSELGKLVTFRSSWDHPVPWKMVMSAEAKRYVFAPLETCMVQMTDKTEMYSLSCNEQTLPLKAGFKKQWESFKQMVSNPSLPNKHNLQSSLQAMEIAEKFYNSFL